MEWISRVLFTPQQKAELWERWKSGQCIASIARTLGRRNKSGVYRILAASGGIVPAPRRRGRLVLRPDEREEISRGLAMGHSIRRIASSLGRTPSTVSREIRRNGGSQGSARRCGRRIAGRRSRARFRAGMCRHLAALPAAVRVKRFCS
jgi:hypothetical protein